MSLWFEVVATFMACANTAWMIAGSALYGLKMSGMSKPDTKAFKVLWWIFCEVKPFFRTFAILIGLYHALPLQPFSWLSVLVTALQLAYFHIFKDLDDDDDRWKRRRQKLLDKVTITGGKLAVIPA